jgi:hypothetical protein
MIAGMTMIDPHSAAAAVGLANSAFTAVKSAFELAKKTTDLELKHEISATFDSVLELKVKVYELAEENRDLREQLTKKATVKRNHEFGYYFVDDDPDPHCAKCYEVSGKLIHLPASRPSSGGVRRDCMECRHTTWEQPMSAQPSRTRFSRSSWMGN